MASALLCIFICCSSILPLLHSPVQAELFSAVIDLQRMLDTEQTLYETLMRYVVMENSRLERVSQLARDISLHHESTRVNATSENILSNPLTAFILLKRFAVNWRDEIQTLIETRPEALEELQARFRELEEGLPSREDLRGSVDAIIRLQKTYKLDTQSMADGEIMPNKRSIPFTAEECFFIGHQRYLKDDFHYAQLWMTEALRRLNNPNSPPVAAAAVSLSDTGLQVNRTTVLDYLAYSLYKDNDLRQAAEITRQLLDIDPQHPRAVKNMEYFQELFMEGKEDADDSNANDQSPSSYEAEQNMYMGLCRNEDLLPYKHRHQLYCRFYVPHPFYHIGPVKEEIMYFDPRVVLWHDIIHNGEIEQIKELATPKLKRATIQNSLTGKLETASYRVSKSAWLPIEMDPVTKSINARITAITGLNIETAEDLQVVNYGLGGQYEPHFDFARRREKTAFEKQLGNRIATLIYYLSDVDAGGFTIFTELGLRLQPKKGAAAFWWNLLPSGDGDLATRHAACPVLLGSKWVMNKWFHERGQEFTRPCMLQENGLDYDSTYRIERVPDVE